MKFPFRSFLSLFALGGVASATVVNIDFNTALSSNYTGLAGAPDAAGVTAVWNPIVGAAGSLSSVDLLDSTNAPTSVDFSISGIESVQNIGSEGEMLGGYVNLMRDYLRIDGVSSGTVVSTTGKFSGLSVGGTYDLYFYGQGQLMGLVGGSSLNRGQNSLFSVGLSSKQTEWDDVVGGDGILTENIEYVKFTAVADINGEIAFSFANVVATGGTPNVLSDLAPNGNTPPTNTGSRFAALNAIQLVAVPEPSVALLGVLGMLGFVARRRR